MTENPVNNRLRDWMDRVRSTLRPSGNGSGPGTNGRRLGRLRTVIDRILEGDPAPGLEAYRRLTFQLHHGLPRGEARRSVLVTTPREASETAAGAMGLARSLAEELRSPVLLVEASEERDLSALLDAPAVAGLTDLLLDDSLPAGGLPLPTSHENVHFLPRGQGETGSGVAPERIASVMDELAGAYDFVVVGGGAVLANGLALDLARHVGQVLLLVAEGRTHIEDLDSAQNALRLCRAERVAVVLTERLGVHL